MAKKHSPRADKVRAYLVNNKTATPMQVAKATGVSYGYTYKVMFLGGYTRKKVFVDCWTAEEEAKSKKAPTLWEKLKGIFA